MGRSKNQLQKAELQSPPITIVSFYPFYSVSWRARRINCFVWLVKNRLRMIEGFPAKLGFRLSGREIRCIFDEVSDRNVIIKG